MDSRPHPGMERPVAWLDLDLNKVAIKRRRSSITFNGATMLTKTFAIFLILVGATLAYGIQVDTEWVKFTSPEGRFSLLLPHEPKLEVVADPTNAKLRHNRFSEFEQSYAFVIEYFDKVIISDPEKYLDGARDGIMGALNGTLIRENKITLDGYPGRELELSLTSKNGTVVSGRTRIYAAGGSFYSMSYVWRKDMDETLASKIGEKYFSSIKFASGK